MTNRGHSPGATIARVRTKQTLVLDLLPHAPNLTSFLFYPAKHPRSAEQHHTMPYFDCLMAALFTVLVFLFFDRGAGEGN